MKVFGSIFVSCLISTCVAGSGFIMPSTFYPPQKFPSKMDAAYPTCPESQLMAITMATYNSGSVYSNLVDYQINCDEAMAINDDGILLCKGEGLPYNATSLVAFSGTHNFMDVISDAEAYPVYNNETGIEMMVHAGFNGKFYQWKPTLDKWFSDCENAGQILLSGHSLGGAIAHIASLYLDGKGCDVQLVTAGEPATFKPPFSFNELNLTHTRYVTYYKQKGCYNSEINDLVPVLSGIAGYEHAKTSVHLPLQRIDDCTSNSTSYSTNDSGSWYSDAFIHEYCYYQSFIENSFCAKN